LAKQQSKANEYLSYGEVPDLARRANLAWFATTGLISLIKVQTALNLTLNKKVERAMRKRKSIPYSDVIAVTLANLELLNLQRMHVNSIHTSLRDFGDNQHMALAETFTFASRFADDSNDLVSAYKGRLPDKELAKIVSNTLKSTIIPVKQYIHRGRGGRGRGYRGGGDRGGRGRRGQRRQKGGREGYRNEYVQQPQPLPYYPPPPPQWQQPFHQPRQFQGPPPGVFGRGSAQKQRK